MSSHSTTTGKEPWLDPELYPIPPYAWVVPVVIYFWTAWIMRTHRLRTTLELFPYTDRRSFTYMTLNEAYFIQKNLMELEFPFTFQKSLQFALFRTYGIPSISRLLTSTKEFVAPETASKRLVDTEVLVAEFIANHPQTDRAIEAIARMNYLHNLYARSGRISNEDNLYTLSLFALEPARWIDRFEWRKLEEFERCAIGTFWKALGDAQGIDFSPLKKGHKANGDSSEEGQSGDWADGFEWLQDVEVWAIEYEKQNMVPDRKNFETAEATVALLLWYVPSWMKPVGRQMIYALMDERLRTAMMYPQAQTFFVVFVHISFFLRKYFLRYFGIPRLPFFAVHNISDKPSKRTGRYHFWLYETAPWYVPPTIWNRYISPWVLITRMMGLPVPGDDGDKYKPQGYKINEIGPRIFDGKGQDEMAADIERIKRLRRVGDKRGARPFGRSKIE